MFSSLRLGAVVLVLCGGAVTATAETHSRPEHGCFKVLADSLNVRRTAFSTGEVIGVAHRDDVLIKRKRWCTWRGFWCGVTTEDGLEGYVDKKFIEMTPCPARLSQ